MRNFLKTIILSVSIILPALMQAQSKTNISGKLKDVNDKAIPSATIELLKMQDSALVKADITDGTGNYEFVNIEAGQYLIKCTSVGFIEKYLPIEKKNDDGLLVPAITMENTSSKLKEVTIVAKKPMIEVKADKTVFNVEASINAQGSSAYELLRKSPGVQVDNNDNISMKGKTGVRIYVDGKPSQLDAKDLAAYLKSINSNDIEAIEMISNPSAKYDASGNAGIINIKLKKNKKFGTNGSINLGFIQGITPKGNGSVNLNYRDKKINVFGNVGVDRGINKQDLNIYRIQNDTLYDQKSPMYDNSKSFNVKTGADFFVNSKNTIGVIATVNYNDNKWSNVSHAIVSNNLTKEYLYTLSANNSVPGKKTNANFNFNYKYADTSGREINFDADYGLFRGTGRSIQPNSYIYPNPIFNYTVTNRNNTPTDIDIYTAKIDAEQRLGKGKLGYGAKFALVTTTNTFDFFTDTAVNSPKFERDRSSSFTYKENVNAAYLNYQQQLNDKWSLQVGLRGELTNSDGHLIRANDSVGKDDRVKRNYFDLFPSTAITWNINQKHALNLTYSRRIDRPTYQDLNPFENKLDELTYQKGNPFLKPQYTHNVELTHTLMGMINTTLGYSYVSDYSVMVTDKTGRATYVQQRNLATQQIYSFNIGAPIPIKKWWNSYVNLWFNTQQFNGAIGENKVDRNIFMYGGYMQHTFSLPKEFTLELSGWFNGPGVWGGTWQTNAQGSLDLGLQKPVLNGRGSIKASVTDIFFTAPWRAINDFGGTYIKANGNWESRTFRLNFTWRFGSNQIKSSRERQTGLENEAKRIKQGN